jgi:RND family efflux transporter MFP subunit
MTITVLAVTAVLVAGGIGTFKLARANRSPEDRRAIADGGIPVRVATASVREVPYEISAWGYLSPFVELTVSAEVPGFVQSQHVEASDRVAEGDVLFQLDRALPKSALVKAKAELERARSQHRLARQNHAHIQSLEEKDSVNQLEVSQVTTELEVALAAVHRAEQIVEEARILLDKTEIRSPLRGQVARVHTRQGEYAHVGRPLVDLIETDRLKLVLQMDDRDVITFSEGDPVSMTVEAIPNASFEGLILRRFPSARADSRKFDVEVEVPNPEGRLRPGFSVRATLIKPVEASRSDESGTFASIPRIAVFERFRQKYCYVVSRLDGESVDRAILTRIEALPVPSDPEYVQVIGGVGVGDRVVTTGLPHVTDQTIVRVVE